MLVIGGYNSSNTMSLAAICAERVATYHIEDAACIDPERGHDPAPADRHEVAGRRSRVAGAARRGARGHDRGSEHAQQQDRRGRGARVRDAWHRSGDRSCRADRAGSSEIRRRCRMPPPNCGVVRRRCACRSRRALPSRRPASTATTGARRARGRTTARRRARAPSRRSWPGRRAGRSRTVDCWWPRHPPSMCTPTTTAGSIAARGSDEYPLSWTRTIRLDTDGALQVCYEVTNTHRCRLPFVWGCRMPMPWST